MPRVFIAVGSNLGEREQNIQRAETLLRESRGIYKVRSSKIRETNPVGGPPQGKFLNGVWEVTTILAARELFRLVQEIENRLGRTRAERNEPRIIDLDILSYDGLILKDPDLEIPHPRLHERRFVLEPLAELDPYWLHPVFDKTPIDFLEEMEVRERDPES
ncbi:MAG: 2-amino-4-hydroxy-6-hydroxymethyldihydropteridine diphosphokinase [Candidatus Omnitrophica bacterium]|nr:2-amino-4-hydroxy-6-hydroxymethyldihydropteridine diphosphokinase [Candidatus Omnitrophota bacterium]